MAASRSILACSMIAVLSWTATAPVAAAGEDHYYVALFASQGEPNLPRLAHTFALFIKASGEGEFPKDYRLESHCISWLPATRNVDPLRLRPEPGKNLTFKETMEFVRSLDARVTMWGPFPIKKELYDRSLQQIDRLRSLQVAYVALDRRFRGNGATNCIHAVADIDTDRGSLDTGLTFGEPASAMVVRHFERWFLPPENTGWIRERLSLENMGIRVAAAE